MAHTTLSIANTPATRVAAITGRYSVYAVLDTLLLPFVAVPTSALLRARNRRNLPLVAMLRPLALANGALYLRVIGVIDIAPTTPLYAARALIVVTKYVTTNRMFPDFTVYLFICMPWLFKTRLDGKDS